MNRRQQKPMNKQEIIDFINSHQASFLATTEGDQPRVRGMLIYRADEKGIIFHTGEYKALSKQLAKNPKAEFSFNDIQNGKQVRVSGKAELLNDPELKKEIVSKRDFLKPWVAKNGDSGLRVYRMGLDEARVWTFPTNFEPEKIIKI
jgi:pyridoxamine 5'-phosphate oxidase